MARMYITPSWRDAAAVKRPKPIPPLRYRIAPVEKELDELDRLELELAKQADKMSDDDAHYLAQVISVKRSKLADKRLKGIGEYSGQSRPAKTPQKRLQAPTEQQTVRYARPLSSRQKKLLIICFVFGFLFFKKLLTG